MDTFAEAIEKIFLRDLKKMAVELQAYPDEKSIWLLQGDIKNSAGNLCLHLCGNLQHFIGHGLGQLDYKRDRENEFGARNIPLKDLLAEIQLTEESVSISLKKLDASMLDKEYPFPVFDFPMTVQYFLIHLSAHLGYHLGQINYHRRLVAMK